MRILHLGKYYPPAPGGIESHVQTLARGQADLGHEVSVFCVNHADKKHEDVTHSRFKSTPGITEADGKVRVTRMGRWFGLNRLDICFGLVKKLRAAISGADIVHLHTPNPLMLIAWWFAGDRKTPLVVTHHSDVIKQRSLQVLVRPFEKNVYRDAATIITTSPKYQKGSAQLKSFLDKVIDLPMGIDLSKYLKPTPDICATALGLRDRLGFPLWLMVGRLTYYKGYHVALKALVKTTGRLVIVGSGPMEEELKKQAKLLGISERVSWMSSVGNELLLSLYHAATALWFPSIARSEGFGLVQVEAMACGCPVINSAVPASGVDWVSQHEVTGYTTGVGDSEGLASFANLIANNPSIRERYSRNAKERASSIFGSEEMAQKSISLYGRFCHS